MGKSLKDLLLGFQFQDEQLNPRNVTPDMLSSKEKPQALTVISPFTIPKGTLGWNTRELKDIKVNGLTIEGVKLPHDRQYTLLTNRIGEIYGADAPRILLRGKVDTKKATKKIVNRVARIAGGIFGNKNAVGSFVRNSITGLVSVKQPSDTISGKSTENGLYSDIINGRVDNSINPITGLLTQFRTPSQFKAAIGEFGNGQVKIGGAVVDELTNLSFRGLGWAASKIGLGKQDSGKTKSLSQTLRDSTTSLNSVARFPSVFAESKAKINKEDKPTGIVIGQDQFVKLQDFPNMYDDSPVKTGLTLDGLQYNPYVNMLPGTMTDDYLTKNPSEKSNFVPADRFGRFNTRAGEMPQDSRLGFNPNSVLFVNRSQSFTGIFNNYQLAKASETTLNSGIESNGNTFSFSPILRANVPDSPATTNTDSFLLVKNGIYDEDFIYKTPDIISKGKPKRFSEKVVGIFGLPNYYLFGGYSDRKATPIKGDHRLKSNIPLEQNKSQDLILISIDGNAMMANITGLTDTATPSWGDVQGIGSPYKFYFYESFEREISFKAQIYATSEKTLPLVWKKANEIMKLTSGKAQGQLGIQGKVVKMRIGDILKAKDGNGIWGFLSSCTMTVPDISPWEIELGKQAPFVCELDISFKVIHTKEQDFYDTLSDKENPLFKESDSKYPRKSPPKPVPFVKSERQLDTEELVKLEDDLALDSLSQLEVGLQQDIFVSNVVGNAVNESNIAKQRLQEIENIQTEANRFATGDF